MWGKPERNVGTGEIPSFGDGEENIVISLKESGVLITALLHGQTDIQSHYAR